MESTINAREKLDELVKVTNNRNMTELADFIENLDGDVAKHILKMIAYGDFKKFIVEDIQEVPGEI